MPKVMLLEDDPTMLQLLDTLLMMEGFDVYAPQVWSPEGIPAKIMQEGPHLLVMDVNLKQANGLILLKNIRQTPGLSHLKVILTSGMDLHEQSHQAGADGFLLKPFMPEELVRTIRARLAS
jgi:DNA-binding response OmpR family regulator